MNPSVCPTTVLVVDLLLSLCLFNVNSYESVALENVIINRKTTMTMFIIIQCSLIITRVCHKTGSAITLSFAD